MRGLPASLRRVVSCTLAVALGALLITMLGRPALCDEPRSDPRRCFPARGLVAYVEFDGLRAHEKAWEATAARAMLVRTPAGAMMSDIAVQLADRLLKQAPRVGLKGADLMALEDHVIHEGFACGYFLSGQEASLTLVLNGAGRPVSRERFERLLGTRVAPAAGKKPPISMRLRGREVFQWLEAEPVRPLEDPFIPAAAPPVRPLGDPFIPDAAPAPDPAQRVPSSPWLSAWFEKDDLVLVATLPDDVDPFHNPARGNRSGDAHMRSVELALDVIEGKKPNVSSHAAYASAASEGKDIRGFEADGLFFVELGPDVLGIRRVLKDQALSRVSMTDLGPSPQPTRVAEFVEEVPEVLVPAPPVPPAAAGIGPEIGPGPEPLPPTIREAASAPAAVPSIPAQPAASRGPDAGRPARPPMPSRVVRASPSSEIPVSPRPANDRGDQVKASAVPHEAGNAGAVKPDDDPIKALGLDGIKRVVGRWGFQGKALLTDVRIEAPAPRMGLSGWIDQPGFDRDRLPPIPREARSFVVNSFDPDTAYARLSQLAKTIDPEVVGGLDELERVIRTGTGLQLREDLLAHVGPTWCVFPVQTGGQKPGEHEPFDPAGYVLVAELKDVDAFAKVVDTLAARASAYLRDRERPDGPAAAAAVQDGPPTLAVERLPAPHRGYRLTSPSRLVLWLNDEVQPTIAVGRTHVAVAANAELAVQALALATADDNRWRPTGELSEALACLPRTLTFLSIGDAQDSPVPGLIANLPTIVQLLSTELETLAEPASLENAGDLLSRLGIPGRGSFRLRIDPARRPTAEALQAHLFPSVLAATVDDRGIRFIHREAFPLAVVGKGSYLRSRMEWGTKGLKRDLKLGWKWPHW